MCGIAGVVTRRPVGEAEAILQRMLPALRHRGPDDEGTLTWQTSRGWSVGFAHTRLAILDLSHAGHQPMVDSVTQSVIVYNGEIYNHDHVRQSLSRQQYRSSSDTETLLAAWSEKGPAALENLRGMFAFALFDAVRECVWLVRDRLGVKPLYLAKAADGTWVFASELRVLLASELVSRQLDKDAVQSYLAYGAIPSPLSALHGVESLAAGESWSLDLRSHEGGEPRRARYWLVPGGAPGQRLSWPEAVEGVQRELLDSFSLRMVSDVPVGVFLSGGIDSSAIVAGLHSLGHQVHSFSVVFEEKGFDESKYSAYVAKAFDAKHTTLVITPQDVLSRYDDAVSAYDQPSIDGVNTYFVSQATRSAGVKVALSGIGSDELFAGYPYFRAVAALDHRAQRALLTAASVGGSWLRPGNMQWTKLRRLIECRSPLERYSVCRQVMPLDRRQLLYPEVGDAIALPALVRSELADRLVGLDAVNAHSLCELALYLHNMLLRDTDQMSMAHALEVREPFLDHHLVEFVTQLPGRMKLRAGARSRRKGLLVDALPDPPPSEVLNRRKMGFVFPWEEWLRGPLQSRVEAQLLAPENHVSLGMNGAGVRKVWHGFLDRRPGIRYTDILALYHLFSWAQRHRLSMS